MTKPISLSTGKKTKWVDKISLDTYKKITLVSFLIIIVILICIFTVIHKIAKTKKQVTEFSSQLKNEIGNRSQLVGKLDSTIQSLKTNVVQQHFQQQQPVQTQMYPPGYPTQQQMQQMQQMQQPQMQQQQIQPQSQNGLVFEETKRGGSGSSQKQASSSAGSSPFKSLGMNENAMSMDFGEGISI